MKKFISFLMIGMLVVCLCVPAMAAGTTIYNSHELPAEYKVDNKVYSVKDEYFKLKETYPNVMLMIKHNSDGYKMYRIFERPSILNGTNYYMGKSFDYFTIEDSYWVYQGSSPGANLGSITDFIWSTHILYLGDGSIYIEGDETFRRALPAEILEVTEEQMEKTLPEVVGTMKILVLCGVGLMALLVGLKLFGKVLLPYLRK